MLEAPEAELLARAELILAGLPQERAELVWAGSRVGGGALPLLELHGPVVSVDPGAAGAPALAARLRQGPVAVIGRIQHERLLLDPRTLSDDEAAEAAGLVNRAMTE
jgi:L-seryl-tRNA(Ser) seleniumtransferase